MSSAPLPRTQKEFTSPSNRPPTNEESPEAPQLTHETKSEPPLRAMRQSPDTSSVDILITNYNDKRYTDYEQKGGLAGLLLSNSYIRN